MALNAQAAASKWSQRSSAAAQDYVAGARATDKDPTQLAIQNAQGWINGVQDAFVNGRYQRGLQAAGKAGWLAGIESKGAANYGTGVAAAEQKVATAYTKLFSFMGGVLGNVNNMPRTTLQQRIARSVAFQTQMAAYRNQG